MVDLSSLFSNNLRLKNTRTETKNEIHVDNEESMKKFLSILKSTQDYIFMFLYMDGCGHCEAMKPEWEKLLSMKEIESKLLLVRINATQINALPQELTQNLLGFPTLYMVKDGKIKVEFMKERTAEEMKKFILEVISNEKDNSIGGAKSKKKNNKTIKKKNKKSFKTKNSSKKQIQERITKTKQEARKRKLSYTFTKILKQFTKKLIDYVHFIKCI